MVLIWAALLLHTVQIFSLHELLNTTDIIFTLNPHWWSSDCNQTKINLCPSSLTDYNKQIHVIKPAGCYSVCTLYLTTSINLQNKNKKANVIKGKYFRHFIVIKYIDFIFTSSLPLCCRIMGNFLSEVYSLSGLSGSLQKVSLRLLEDLMNGGFGQTSALTDFLETNPQVHKSAGTLRSRCEGSA